MIDYAKPPDKQGMRPCWGCGKKTTRLVKSGLVFPRCRKCEALGK